MLSVDDRLVPVSASEESSTPESVGVSETTPASVTLSSSEDEVTQRLSFLSKSDIGSWGERFMVGADISIPTCNERACYPPEGYQCIYQDALEAGLRIPPHPFIIALMNFYQVGLGQIVPNSWRLVISFLILALREKIALSVELFNLFFSLASHPSKNS